MDYPKSFALWLQYPTQQIALDFFYQTKTRNPEFNLILLCKEIDVTGIRRYFLSTYEYFFKQYIKMHPHQRCWYEIIREDYPCKLYFDIEYNKEINASTNAEQAMLTFKNFLKKYIEIKLKISISIDNMIHLHSDTPKKFSRHIIINLKNKLFKNNIECGIFIAKMCDEIINIVKRNPTDPLQQLFINDIKNHKKLFIDQSVYTKNRCFRLPFSSKLKNIKQNKPVYLQPINKKINQIIKYEDFIDMLVCPLHLKNTHFVNVNGYKLHDIQLNYTKKYGIVNNDIVNNNIVNNDKIINWISNVIRKNLFDIDRKIKINFYKMYNDYDNILLLYHVHNYRYCANICREHKRNNVYFIIDYNKS